MKKTLVTILALSGMAMAANVTVTDLLVIPTQTAQAGNRLDLNFNGSANRTVTIKTNGNVNIAGTDGYGMNDGTNTVIFDLGGTLTSTGTTTIKGQGNTTNAGQFQVIASMGAEEVMFLEQTGSVSADLIVADYISCLGNKANALTLTLNGIPDSVKLTDGGKLVKLNDNYYSIDSVTNTGSYWNLDTTNAVELEKGKYYTYVMVTAANGAAPKAIGYVATLPEPATATLSLLALAGLAARRRRH